MCLEGTHLSQGISIDIAFCKTKRTVLPITTNYNYDSKSN